MVSYPITPQPLKTGRICQKRNRFRSALFLTTQGTPNFWEYPWEWVKLKESIAGFGKHRLGCLSRCSIDTCIPLYTLENLSVIVRQQACANSPFIARQAFLGKRRPDWRYGTGYGLPRWHPTPHRHCPGPLLPGQSQSAFCRTVPNV